MKSLIILIFIIISLPSCSDNSVEIIPINNTILEDDTTILRTDEFGNSQGGDTSDWCNEGIDSVYELQPVYPNPVSDYFTITFSLPIIDHVKIYFKNNADTIFILNELHDPGHYQIQFKEILFRVP